MKILITAATELELVHVKSLISDAKYAVTGIGSVATTYNLTKILRHNKFDLVLNVGIAGSYNSKFEIGSVVYVVKEEFGDFGIHDQNGFKTIFEEGLIPADALPFKNGILINHHKLTTNDLPLVKGLTLSIASGNQSVISALTNKFNADIETMEGAAFFYVCLNEGVKFAQIRGISNHVEPRNKANWDIRKALSKLAPSVNDFIIKNK